MPESDLSDAFAAVLTRRREARGFSKAALAERAGLHQTYIGMLESGKSSPTLDSANLLAKALGVTLEKMIAEAQIVCGKAKQKRA